MIFDGAIAPRTEEDSLYRKGLKRTCVVRNIGDLELKYLFSGFQDNSSGHSRPTLGSRQAANFDFVTERRKSEVQISPSSGTPTDGIKREPSEQGEDKRSHNKENRKEREEGEKGGERGRKREEENNEKQKHELHCTKGGGILKTSGRDRANTDATNTSTVTALENFSLPSIDGHSTVPTVEEHAGVAEAQLTQQKTNKEILQLFKSEDLKSLARSLTDADGFGIGTGLRFGQNFTRGRGMHTDRTVPMTTGSRFRGDHSKSKLFQSLEDVFQKVKTES